MKSITSAYDTPANGTVRGICSHDCPDSCVWEVKVEDGKAITLRGDPDHPITKGGLCAKVNPFLERVYSPERVLYPLRRIGKKGEGKFERVSWEQALTEVSNRLMSDVETYGASSILPYSFAGSQGLLQFASLDRRFFSLLRASRLDRGLCGERSRKPKIMAQKLWLSTPSGHARPQWRIGTYGRYREQMRR